MSGLGPTQKIRAVTIDIKQLSEDDAKYLLCQIFEILQTHKKAVDSATFDLDPNDPGFEEMFRFVEGNQCCLNAVISVIDVAVRKFGAAHTVQ